MCLNTHSSLGSVLYRDNVEWTTEQEECAKKKVLENSQPLPSEKQGLTATDKHSCVQLPGSAELTQLTLCFSLQRNTTAGQMNTGTISTLSMRIVSSKTVTGSSQSSPSWPRSVILTMWSTLRSRSLTTVGKMAWTKSKAGTLWQNVVVMTESQGSQPPTAFWR